MIRSGTKSLGYGTLECPACVEVMLSIECRKRLIDWKDKNLRIVKIVIECWSNGTRNMGSNIFIHENSGSALFPLCRWTTADSAFFMGPLTVEGINNLGRHDFDTLITRLPVKSSLSVVRRRSVSTYIQSRG